MHKNNIHAKGYDFKILIADTPELGPYVINSNYGNLTIDFSNPVAVKWLNTALLKTHYGIKYWTFPDAHLCPPIPSRVDYIHTLHELLQASKLNTNITVLDIGTGATCIYPLLGHSVYKWKFIASDIDKKALHNANEILSQNNLNDEIELRFQNDSQSIFKGILKPTEIVTATLCNPPFYKSETEALDSTKRKLKGLGSTTNEITRNFSGTSKELWYPGGEKAFLHNYLYQSSLLRSNCFWYTSLVSKKEHLKSMQISLKKLGATSVKILQLNLGNKISRVVAWTFLSEKEQQEWSSSQL